jgi:hypothetical protein
MNHLDPLAGDRLAVRLDSLAVEVPSFPGFALPTRRRPRAARPTARRVGLAGAVAIAAMLATTAAAFPEVLTAISRDVLEIAGLKSTQVSPAAGEAHHGPTSVAVNGAYADAVSTVVFVSVTMFDTPCDRVAAAEAAAGRCGDQLTSSVDTTVPCRIDPELIGAPCVPVMRSGPYLTDQFGQRYPVIGGGGIGVGAYPMLFQPIRGQAQSAGAQLTLHVPMTRWADAAHKESFDLAVPLSGSLAPKPAIPLPALQPITDVANGVTYEAPELKTSGTYLQAHTRLSGNLDRVITKVSSSGGTGTMWPGVFLVDPAGHYQIPLAGGLGPFTVSDKLQDETRVFKVHGPGTYRLVVAHDSNAGAAPGGPTSRVLAEWSVSIP